MKELIDKLMNCDWVTFILAIIGLAIVVRMILSILFGKDE